jgi:SAM-dependent methyltransferase
MAGKVEATQVDDLTRQKALSWGHLREGYDTTGLLDGEEAIFRSADERDAYFRSAIYGERFNTAVYLKPHREFNQMMFVKTGLRNGRILLIGEALEPIGLVPLAQETLGDGVEIEPFEMRHLALARKSGRWPVYREISQQFSEEEFDAVVAAQWHHCDDLIPEFEAMARIVKRGGKLVLVDNGPSASTFELAKEDVVLSFLLRQFVTWAGSRHVSPSEAFEYQRKMWLMTPVDEVFAAASQILQGARLWEYKGMAMIDGVKRA